MVLQRIYTIQDETEGDVKRSKYQTNFAKHPRHVSSVLDASHNNPHHHFQNKSRQLAKVSLPTGQRIPLR